MQSAVWKALLIVLIVAGFTAASLFSQARLDDLRLLAGLYFEPRDSELRVGGFYETGPDGFIRGPAVCDPDPELIASHFAGLDASNEAVVLNRLGSNLPFLSAIANVVTAAGARPFHDTDENGGYRLVLRDISRVGFGSDEAAYAYLGDVLDTHPDCRNRIFVRWKQGNKCTVILSDALIKGDSVIGYKATDWCIFPHSTDEGFYTGKPLWAEEPSHSGFFDYLALAKDRFGLIEKIIQ